MKGKQRNQKERAEQTESRGGREISWMCVALSKMQMNRPLCALRNGIACVRRILTSQISYLAAGAVVEQKLQDMSAGPAVCRERIKRHNRKYLRFVLR